jgi:DNA polymerase (family 10)
MDNVGIARALTEIAALLDLESASRFKVRAYERGARAVEALSESAVALARAGRLRSVPGIVPSLAATVLELGETGQSELLTRLREGVPAGAAELAGVLTRRQMVALHKALGIASLADLRAACEAGRVRTVPGFGARTERRFLAAMAAPPPDPPRLGLADATHAAGTLLAHLRRHPAVERADVAGELRRRVELIDGIDIVAATDDPATVMAHLAGAPSIGRAQALDGAGEARLRLVTGGEVRLHAVPPAAYAITLHRATGSDAHVAKLEAAARGRGVRLAADGLYLGSRRLALRGEAELYQHLGLPEIPPELREDAGEVEAALAGTLPRELVRSQDIRGFVHCHTVYSDGRHTVEEMARGAEARGMEYLTITDHSPTASYAGGLDPERLRRQWDEIASVQEGVRVRLLRGTECDILKDGALDYPDAVLEQLDVVIASIHNRHRLSPEEMTRRLVRAMRHPRFKVWGHPLGRYVASRPPLECDMDAVLDAVAESRAAIEVNGDPRRLDLPPRWIREARRRGIPFVVSTDAHSVGGLDNLRWGLDMARRGWLTRDRVLNTLDVEAFRRAVRP